MKRTAVFIGFVAAFLAGIVFLNRFLLTETVTAPVVAEGIQNTVVVQRDVGEANPAEDRGSRPGSGAEKDETSSTVNSLESQAVKDNALNHEFILGADHLEERFSRLAEEFRTSGSVEGSKKREELQLFLYAQDPLLSGQVSLDVLECGSQLCVAEFRGVDASALRSFLDDSIDPDGLESKASIEVPTQQPNIGRLIFSHDPEVIGIILPPFGDWFVGSRPGSMPVIAELTPVSSVSMKNGAFSHVFAAAGGAPPAFDL